MTHTAQQMIPALNEQVSVRFESIRVDCIVNDVKSSYGNIRLLVIPIAGGGSQWVELGRVQRCIVKNELALSACPKCHKNPCWCELPYSDGVH